LAIIQGTLLNTEFYQICRDGRFPDPYLKMVNKTEQQGVVLKAEERHRFDLSVLSALGITHLDITHFVKFFGMVDPC